MSDSSPSRRQRTNLLARPPCGSRTYERDWSALIVDSADQLEVLADLLGRGLLTSEEYERHKAKVIEP
jgi:hypothetical protein